MVKRIGLIALAVVPSLIFLLLLVQKFGGAEDTKQIFGLIEHTFAGWGLPGLFVGGIFNAYVVGAIELVAALLLLGGIFRPAIQGFGALIGTAVVGGAIFFHLFTDLGVNVPFATNGCPLINTVGGPADSRDAIVSAAGCAPDPQLFVMALITFGCCAGMLFVRRGTLLGLIGRG